METLQEIKDEIFKQIDFNNIYKILVVLDKKIQLTPNHGDDIFPSVDELKSRVESLIVKVYEEENKPYVIVTSGGFTIYKIRDIEQKFMYSVHFNIDGFSGSI